MKIFYNGRTIDSNEFISQDWMSLDHLARERNGTGYSPRTIPTSDMITMLRKFFEENGRMPRNEDFHGEILKFSAACFHARFGGSRLILDELCKSAIDRRARGKNTTLKEGEGLYNFAKVRSSLDDEKLQRFIDEVEAFYTKYGVLPTCIDLANCQFSISRGNFYNKFRSFELLKKILMDETSLDKEKDNMKVELLTFFDDIVKNLGGKIPETISDASRIAKSLGFGISGTDIVFACGSYAAFVEEYQREFNTAIHCDNLVDNADTSSYEDASKLANIDTAPNVDVSIIKSTNGNPDSLSKVITSLIISSRETEMNLSELISAFIIGVESSGVDASKLIAFLND